MVPTFQMEPCLAKRILTLSPKKIMLFLKALVKYTDARKWDFWGILHQYIFSGIQFESIWGHLFLSKGLTCLIPRKRHNAWRRQMTHMSVVPWQIQQITLEKLPNVNGSQSKNVSLCCKPTVLSLGSYDSGETMMLKGKDDGRSLCDILLIGSH